MQEVGEKCGPVLLRGDLHLVEAKAGKILLRRRERTAQQLVVVGTAEGERGGQVTRPVGAVNNEPAGRFTGIDEG